MRLVLTFRSLLRKILEALLRVLFIYDCRGQENIPLRGPAVIASNHPSYLDPVLLSVKVRRPIRFMAWQKLFDVPVLGWIIRSLGAFPVDSRPGHGREAYEKAKSLVLAGKVVGIFPEGKRSRKGWMEESLREGAARLAWETGALLVPATITGAYRAWPYFRSLPRPARIRVRFHRAIDPAPYRAQGEDEALPALLAELRRRVERSLLPGVKADVRISRIYETPAPPPRLHEWGLAVGFALLLAWRGAPWILEAVPLAYLAYTGVDYLWIRQSRVAKWLRNTSPVAFLVAFGPVLLASFGLPAVPAGASLAAVLAGALLPYFYERAGIALGYVRGVVLTAGFELAALQIEPTGLGPHVAFPVFAATYAAVARTVFWRYSAPFLALYAIGSWPLLGGAPLSLLPHALAGFLAWLTARTLPYRPRLRSRGRTAEPVSGSIP